jgi:hypothetical protein
MTPRVSRREDEAAVRPFRLDDDCGDPVAYRDIRSLSARFAHRKRARCASPEIRERIVAGHLGHCAFADLSVTERALRALVSLDPARGTAIVSGRTAMIRGERARNVPSV